MADAESISLEETNKIRVSLGLAPLKLPSADAGKAEEGGPPTADDEERRAVENLNALRAEQAKATEQTALKERLKK
jgi:U4/U6.U5 tri-snRNP-associated protein 1